MFHFDEGLTPFEQGNTDMDYTRGTPLGQGMDYIRPFEWPVAKPASFSERWSEWRKLFLSQPSVAPASSKRAESLRSFVEATQRGSLESGESQRRLAHEALGWRRGV